MTNLGEITVWEKLSDEQRSASVEEAKGLILGTKDWAIGLHGPADKPVELSEIARQEISNPEYVAYLDESIFAALMRLKSTNQRPLVPLYVALWTMALELPREEVTPAQALAIAMLMRRIQDTAIYVHEFNQDTKNWRLQNELRGRGFLR